MEVTTRTKQLVDNFEEARLRQQYGDAASTRLKNGGKDQSLFSGFYLVLCVLKVAYTVPFSLDFYV